MYIDKWWGNVTCGDTDDSMLLMDYFEMKEKNKFTLNEILKDVQLDIVLGKKFLYESADIDCYFLLGGEDENYRADFQIPINFIIDIAALVLQSLAEGDFANEDVKFSISAEKEELTLIVAELENAVQKPDLYYPDFLQDAFSEMKAGIVEICSELKAYK